MPRPRPDKPYVCGPYKHGAQFRIIVYTYGSGAGSGNRSGRTSYRRYFPTYETAQAAKRDYNRTFAASGRTIGDVLDAYVDEHLRRKKANKETSIGTSRYRVRALLDLDMPLVDLTPSRAQRVYDEMIEDGYSADYHHGSLMEARAMMNFAIRKGWVRANPFERVENVGKKRRRKKQLRVNEARIYTRHCLQAWAENKDRSAVAALLPLNFNLRASEVARLVARDVDDNGRLLWVAYGEDEETGDDHAKTDSSRRTVLVPKHMVPLLRELAESPATPDGHLFAKESLEPADRHWVRYHALRHATLAGTPPITTHGLRGTFASIGVAGGAATEVVARELGHDPREQGRTARDHYIDPGVAVSSQAARVAESLFEGVPEPVDSEKTPRIDRAKPGNSTET